ncbi:hypothetical protein OG579_17125 [Williamsia herbipolensis]|uniref:Uncharacterized protein n=1 Tax=Williamsia herbipolensis TaxID=1603258 RepID=A0AAU4K0A2_9NOCA|nr:hypothetical protein [Williamsia herbipolensis]
MPSTPDLLRAVLHDDPVLAATLTMVAVTHPDDHAKLLTRILRPGRGRLSAAKADRIADTLTLAITGTNRWTFAAIWQRSMDTWPIIDGTLQASGVAVLELPPEAATNAVTAIWWQILTRGDGSQWEKWMDQVTAQPARAIEREVVEMTTADAEAEFAAVAAFAASAGGSTGTTITVQGQTQSPG